MLSQFYEEVNKDGAKNLQIVFVTSDKDDAAFQGYYETMPWTAVKFETDRAPIKKQHGVKGIPMLSVFKADGTLIEANARVTVSNGQSQVKHADVLDNWENPKTYTCILF